MAKTGEEVGYADAMRQVHRTLQRRLKALEEELEEAPEEQSKVLCGRIEEVKHMLEVVESLHR